MIELLSWSRRGRGQPNQRWVARPVSYSERSRCTVSSSETSDGATSHQSLGAGQVDVRDDRDDDHDRAVVPAGLGQRRAHVVGGLGADGPRAEAVGDLDQVDVEVLAVQARLLLGGLLPGEVEGAGAVAELVAELAAVPAHLQPVDDLVAVVLRDHDGDGEALLGGGDQLGGRHQERAVADERPRPASRGRGRRAARPSRRGSRSPCRRTRTRGGRTGRRWRPTPSAGPRAGHRRRRRSCRRPGRAPAAAR